MYNKFLLNITVKKDWQRKIDPVILNKEFFVIAAVAGINILGEFLLRRILTPSLSSPLLQSFHIFIFIFFPAYLIFRSLPKVILLSSLLLFLIGPLYFLIENNTLGFYFSSLFTFSWLFYYLFFRQDRKILEKIGLQTKSLGKNLLIGSSVGAAFCIHIWYVLFLTDKLALQKFILPVFFIKFFLEVSFSLIGMEVFFRYLLFRRLTDNYNFPYVTAATISTIFFLGPFIANPQFSHNPVWLISTTYYVILEGYLSCYLVYRTKSLLPSLFANLIISLFLSTLIS